MFGRVGIIGGVVGSLVAAVFVPIGPGSAAVAQAGVATPALTAAASPHAVPVKSSFDTANRSISRDIGLSVPLPNGRDLWLFGDTAVFQRASATSAWKVGLFVDGSTALEAKYTRGQVPSGGEIPSGAPTRFVPQPNDVYLPDGSGTACTRTTAAFPGRWPTGAVVMPSNSSIVIVTYTDVCVTHPTPTTAATRAEGWGYMLYNWRSNQITSGPNDVFRPKKDGATLPPSQNYGSAAILNKKLMMFSSSCTRAYLVCASGHVWSASMAPTAAALNNPSSYKGTLLTTDATGPFTPLSVSVGKYPSGLRLVENTSIGGGYKIFSAPSVGAKWHLARTGKLPGCPSHHGFCFALQGHPELSTASSVFVSYKDPDSGPGGQIVVSAVPD